MSLSPLVTAFVDPDSTRRVSVRRRPTPVEGSGRSSALQHGGAETRGVVCVIDRDPGQGVGEHAGAEGFAPLSLADLLNARDGYHVYLVSQRRVVATADDRYLVRVEDDADQPRTLMGRLASPPGERPPRTPQYSSVSPWPCVLVFFDDWIDAEEIRQAPDQMVPWRLDLPDSRVLPTWVVYVPPDHAGSDELASDSLGLPSPLLGDGNACLAETEGRQRVGTIAGVVSDGGRTYALTNRHVAGRLGQRINTLVGGVEVPIDTAAAQSAGRVPFQQAYRGPGLGPEASGRGDRERVRRSS